MLPWTEEDRIPTGRDLGTRQAHYGGTWGVLRVWELDAFDNRYAWSFENQVISTRKLPLVAESWEKAKEITEAKFAAMLRDFQHQLYLGDKAARKSKGA